MLEITGNLWDQKADAICVTTNGSVRKDGKAVMGRGCALQAKKRFPGVDETLGAMLKEFGNHVTFLKKLRNCYVFSFPIKERWQDDPDRELIHRSALEIRKYADLFGYKRVLISRPTNRKPSWNQVKPVLEDILDNRFCIVSDLSQKGETSCT